MARSRWSGSDGPVALALTRQKLPVLPGTAELATEGVAARRLRPGRAADADGGPVQPDLILIATGSELALAMGARAMLDRRGHPHAGRLAALLGAVRGAAGGLPRRGPAAERAPAREHRGRRLAGLGPLGRPGGRDHRHRPLRRLGARRRRSSRTSASPPSTSPSVARGVLTGTVRGVVSPAPTGKRRAATPTPPPEPGDLDARLRHPRRPPDPGRTPVDGRGRDRAAVDERWASRIWQRDTTLWTDDAEVAATIGDRLGWLDAPAAFTTRSTSCARSLTAIARRGLRLGRWCAAWAAARWRPRCSASRSAG